jgi:lysophospholipase L1-like esterase
MRALLLSLLAAAPLASPAAPFTFRDGDRVALLGSTVVERDQKRGALEATLSLAVGDARLVFRNLGWSGDTVFGHARSYFGPPKEGLDRLRQHLGLVKPTVVIACYGAELAFEDAFPRLLPEFLQGYRAWLDLVKQAAADPRVVLVAPPPLENLPGRPAQDAGNERLAALRDALRALAAERGLPFVDTFEPLRVPGTPPLTTDGVHFTPAGQEAWARALAKGLGLAPPPVSDAALRPLILRKDELFFHRHRPANETYLFLFRKHEQGRNAAEIPQFDPLIEDLDARIHQAKLDLLRPAP